MAQRKICRDITCNGAVINEDVVGDIIGNRNVINGNVTGDIIGNHNVVNGHVFGDCIGSNNILHGKIHGDDLGRSNIIDNRTSKTKGSIKKKKKQKTKYHSTYHAADAPTHNTVVGNGIVQNIFGFQSYGNTSVGSSSISVGKKLIVKGTTVSCIPDDKDGSVMVEDFEKVSTTSGKNMLINDIEYTSPVNISDVLSGVAEPVYADPIAKPKQMTTLPPYSKEKDDEKATSESDTCTICMVNKKKWVNVPCGHYGTCLGCAYEMYKDKTKHLKCVICRADITQVIKLYTE